MNYLRSVYDARYLFPQAFWLLIPLLLLLLVVLLSRRWSKSAFLLRAIAFCLLVLALADPVKEERSEKQSLTALFDLSASITPQGRAKLVEALTPFAEDERKISLFSFGRTSSKAPLIFDSRTGETGLLEQLAAQAEELDTGETNLGTAISSTLSRTDSASMLLLSDGFETIGNAVQAAELASQKGVRLYPLIPDEQVFGRARVRISALEAPVTASSGEMVEFRTSIENTFPHATRGKLELWLESEKLYSQTVEIPAGEEKLISVKNAPAKGGLQRIRAVFKADDGEEAKGAAVERHRWISIKEKSKILLLSGTGDDARVLKQLITLKGYHLEDLVLDGNHPLPASFEGYSSVILNNASKQQVPGKFLAQLDEFVKAGGGLLLVGGDCSYGLGGYIDTKLEEMSPLKFVPPQTEKRRLTNAVVLVIDKSGSMAEDGKIESAKRAALASIQSLKDEDFIGVIGFDAGPFVIIEVQPVSKAKVDAAYRLQNLTAAGKTNLLPALATARQRLQKAGTSRKHIIVLSDGKFPLSSEAYISEINNLRNEGISVSAVALGIEADIPFMKILSKYGKGAFYHTLDASQLPQIFIEDIKVAAGEKTLQEGLELQVAVGPAGVRSTTVDDYPPIRGFVETLPKRGSELELITKKEDHVFPLLASWTYGAGKVVAFTSDANGRWSLPWLRWKEFSKFWSQIIETVKDRSGTQSGDIDFDLRYSVDRKSVVFDLAVYDEKLRTESAPRVTAEIIEPGGEQRNISFQMSKKGRFEARLDNARPGDYRLQLAYGKLKLPALAVSLAGDLFGELPGRGLNVPLLENLAFLSGGRINPQPQDVEGSKRLSENQEHLLIPLVILAFFFILLESFVRERGWEVFRLRRASPQNKLRRIPKAPAKPERLARRA